MKPEIVAQSLPDSFKGRTRDELKNYIFDRLSKVRPETVSTVKTAFENISSSDFEVRTGVVKTARKQIYSNELRNVFADIAASVAVTKDHGLGDQDGLRFLLDYSGSKEADDRNKKISSTFLNGTPREKSKLFTELTNELFRNDPQALTGCTDEEIILNWKRNWETVYKCSKMKEILKGAKKFGVVVTEEREKAMNLMEKKAKPVYEVMSSRVSVIANPYYAQLDERMLRTNNSRLSIKADADDAMMKDYLDSIRNLDINSGKLMKEQIENRLSNLGYTQMKDVNFTDKYGNPYESKDIINIISGNKPVYIMSEEGKIRDVFSISENNGMLNAERAPEPKKVETAERERGKTVEKKVLSMVPV